MTGAQWLLWLALAAALTAACAVTDAQREPT